MLPTCSGFRLSMAVLVPAMLRCCMADVQPHPAAFAHGASWNSAVPDIPEDSSIDIPDDDTSFLQTFTVIHRNRGKRQAGAPAVAGTQAHGRGDDANPSLHDMIDDAVSF
mmetsp:Transcript_104712/g.296311  ORF Transcript_104712/g.296311 Transcript_104712/m.296311 type:complete len:110 (+) Transcript_104712:65-394(+)